MVSNQFDSYEPEELKAGDDCELVWAKLKVQGSVKMPFLLQNNLNDINYGHVRECVVHSIIFWTIYLLDLARNYIDKL